MTAPPPDPDGFGATNLPADQPDDAGVWFLELVSAVDHLGRGPRLGLTVWEALEEAIRSYVADTVALGDGWDPTLAQLAWNDPDPLRTALTRLDQRVREPLPAHLQAAIRRWVTAQAITANNGFPWPHPLPQPRPPAHDQAAAEAAIDAFLAQLEPPED